MGFFFKNKPQKGDSLIEALRSLRNKKLTHFLLRTNKYNLIKITTNSGGQGGYNHFIQVGKNFQLVLLEAPCWIANGGNLLCLWI
jgi:hypothetical protein